MTSSEWRKQFEPWKEWPPFIADLIADLAAAESQAMVDRNQRQTWQRRAEAAEARVRELESAPDALREALIKELSPDRIDSYLDNIKWRKDADPIWKEVVRGHIYHFANTILEDITALAPREEVKP